MALGEGPLLPPCSLGAVDGRWHSVLKAFVPAHMHDSSPGVGSIPSVSQSTGLVLCPSEMWVSPNQHVSTTPEAQSHSYSHGFIKEILC